MVPIRQADSPRDRNGSIIAVRIAPESRRRSRGDGWSATLHLDLTARVTNIADRRYRETLGFGEPRRMVLGGVRVRE